MQDPCPSTLVGIQKVLFFDFDFNRVDPNSTVVSSIRLMYLLEVEPLNLGVDVKALGLELTEPGTGAPIAGAQGARIWSPVLPVLAGSEPWAFDFFSHLDRVRDFCARHSIDLRDATSRSLVIPAPSADALVALLERFEGETFGARAGGPLGAGGSSDAARPDSALEGELARRGVDAYHHAYSAYFFCAVCEFSAGSLILLTNRLWTAEVVRRLAPALRNLSVEVRAGT